jgi:hypothetical protein
MPAGTALARHVRVLAVTRNQAWCLPGHLQAICAHAPCGDVRLDFHYIHYGCSDPTPVVLRRFAQRTGARVTDGGGSADDLATPLAEMRLRSRLTNEAIDTALDDGCDDVLFIHAAVRLPAGGLDALLAADRPIVGGLVCTDRSYDLPLAYREHNVYRVRYLPDGTPHFDAVLGGVAGVQPCAAVTHVCLIDRASLRTGVAPAPHPQGEEFGLAAAALTRGVPVFAHGGVRCDFAPGSEDLYLEPATLARALCPTGTVRLQRAGERQVVTLSAMAVARALQAALPAQLAQAAPGLAGWHLTGFRLDWQQRLAQIEFRAPAG